MVIQWNQWVYRDWISFRWFQRKNRLTFSKAEHSSTTWFVFSAYYFTIIDKDHFVLTHAMQNQIIYFLPVILVLTFSIFLRSFCVTSLNKGQRLRFSFPRYTKIAKESETWTTDHGQATGKLYHLRLRVECTLLCNLQSRARTHAVLVVGLYELLGNPPS